MAITRADSSAAGLRSDIVADRDRAWRAVYDQHFGRVYRLVCRMGAPAAEVEDLTQRAFVVAYKRIREVDDVRDVGAWLRGIAVRVVAEHRRWRRVRAVKQWIVQATWGGKPSRSPEVDACCAEQVDRVRLVLDRMSPKLRDVLVLVDIEEHAPKEAAEILGIPHNTVRSRKQLARKQFARLWRERFGEELTDA